MTGDETTAPLVNLCATWMIDHPLQVRPDDQQQQTGTLAGLRSIADIRNYLVCSSLLIVQSFVLVVSEVPEANNVTLLVQYFICNWSKYIKDILTGSKLINLSFIICPVRVG